MENHRQVLSSDYIDIQLSLEESRDLPRARQPLADTAGNAQRHNLASLGLYHESKAHQPPDRLLYKIPTLPSQPARPSVGNTLELRRQSTRRQRQLRFSRNPIVDSSQYQAYRARQNREGSNSDDVKWPEVLELAFLDALMYLPAMGRRKYSFQGKPHGRNEMIKEYLWIAYVESLPPGAQPDPSMMRGRKQVSSHIQVLKGFLKDHPAYNRLFPPAKGPKNGFEDSFKNDPCLRALSEGHLPRRRSEYYESTAPVVSSTHAPMRPVLFWLLMTSSSLSVDDRHRDVNEEDLYRAGLVAHRFTGLSTPRRNENLEAITNWRQRFPILQQLFVSGELDCEIIHMEASLNLLTTQPPEGSELCSRTVLSIPGRQPHAEWRIVTTLSKPPELYRDPTLDPPMDEQAFLVEVTQSPDGDTRIKVPFPASTWAQAFSCLRNIQSKYEEKQNNPFANGMGLARPAREYVDLISMYQEVQSKAGPGHPFVRRAVILWTFRQALHGEHNGTTWRYLDSTPPRRMCMSPSPRSSHHIQAAMNENYNAWSDTSLHLQHANMLDPFVQGLATPPHTAGLASPFQPTNYAYNSQSFDLPRERLSFVSATNTLDSDTTLVDHDVVASNIDNFLRAQVNLNDFDHTPSGWQLPHTEPFDTGTAWNYTVPSTTPALGWDTTEAKGQSWPDLPLDGKDWTVHEETAGDKDWTDTHVHLATNPSKNSTSYNGQSIEEKLPPWIDSHRGVNEGRDTYENGGAVIPAVYHTPSHEELVLKEEVQTSIEPTAEEWHAVSGDDFDYSQLERLN